jgi:hypothetical protein
MQYESKRIGTKIVSGLAPAILLLCGAASAQPVDLAAPNAVAVSDWVTIKAPAEAGDFDLWRAGMKLRFAAWAPQAGCYTTTYPSTQWRAVSCVDAPARPIGRPAGLPIKVGAGEESAMQTGGSSAQRAAGGGTAQTVGNGTADAAEVSGAYLTSVEGSFDSVTGVTSEKGDGTSDLFGLQLNSYFYPSSSTACKNSKLPSGTTCYQWEQFLYTPEYTNSTQGYVYIQYWTFAVTSSGEFSSIKKCASGWTLTSGQCYTNSSSVEVPASVQALSNLKNLKLEGSISGGNDTVTLTSGSTLYSITAKDSVANLADGWNYAEYNIFGPGGGSAATFNSGSSIVVRINVNNGSTSAPTCLSGSEDGTTGETNNLNLVSPCCTYSGSSPSIAFLETNVSPAPTVSCSTLP